MLLEKIFMHKYIGSEITPQVREKYGVFASVVGIICNILLSASKMLVGMFFGSVAILADGLNNLSDAASAIIGIIGIKIAAKPADEEHPFGHGRYEYIAALIVAFLILEVAVTCFKDSVAKICDGGTMVFAWISVIVLAVSILVKLWLFFFYRGVGLKVDSKVCMATSKDALSDAVLTTATLTSTLVLHFFSLDIDGYVGAVVSVMIFIAGIGVAKDTIEPIIGSAAPKELYDSITEKVEGYEGIVGSHDLIVHSYGPTKRMATIHAEVASNMDIEKAHELVDLIEKETLRDLGIFLVIHMDPIDVCNEEVMRMKSDMAQLVAELEPQATIHDFRVVKGENRTNLIFDVVVPFSMTDIGKRELVLEIKRVVKEQDPKLECVITVENSYCAK
ncbi:MAG: cation diffusion facilitator family transporter [Lachnospiraceae bacterium]|nr:cation diffusion facilitator family transporter [Lachnospiraceae bacterium]